MNTSENIIAFLTRHGSATVKELAESLNLTRADIRYQLKILLNSNRITKMDENVLSPGRGRPASKFKKVIEPEPDNLEEIANLLATNLMNVKTLSQIVDAIWSFEIQSNAPSTSPINKINQVLQFLNRIGVQAVWTASKSGPKLKILHNPYEKENPQPYESVMDSLIKKAVKLRSSTISLTQR